MPTYHEIMTTDLSKLTAAASKWDDMAGEFTKLEEHYRRDVHGITLGSSWQGLSAEAANARFDITLKEFQAAQKEAKAIAALLRDAHAQFVEHRAKVQGVRDDAIKEGMKVSDQGVVVYDTSKLDQNARMAYAHEPGYQESIRAAEDEWNQAIKQAVKAVTDADAGVKLALEAVVVDGDVADGTINGFNSQAKGDVEKYEAIELKEIATRINSGDATPQDLREAQRSFRDNSGNREFSQTLLNGLTAAGTLRFSNELSNLSHSGKDKKTFETLQGGLAATLATATRDTKSSFYKDFRADLQKAGVQKFALDVAADKIETGHGHGQQVRGYQSLVTLMREGSGYSGQFLKDVADDIRAAEDKDQGGDPDVWDLSGNFSAKTGDGWFANDPLDGVLSIMSKDPDTATSYLDPGPGRKNDTLGYLLTERDWDHVDTRDWRGNTDYAGPDTYDKDVRIGLGLALEAGTTGNAAASVGAELGRHPEAQARIMHDTINFIDYGAPEGKGGDEDRVGNGDGLLKEDEYAKVRGPLARAMASYSPDMVDILAGDGPGGRVGVKDALAHGEESQIQNSRSSILRLMRGVSEDKENFFLLHEADQRYMSEQLATEDLSDIEALKNRSAKIGEVFGAVNAVGGDLDLGARDEELSKAGDQRVYGYHTMGGMVTGLPVIGDLAQRTIDGAWNEWLKGVTAEEGLLAREKISSTNDAAEESLDKYFQSWGDEVHRPDTEIGAAQREARQSYTGGRELAYDALRERK